MGTGPSTTPVVSSVLPPETPDTGDVDRGGVDTGDVRGYPIATIEVDGSRLVVAVASTPADQARGLMGVTDLGDLDGMLFVFDPPREVAFWMKDTLLPLRVGYFDAEGMLFQVEEMAVCPDGSCPSHPSTRAVGWALEIPQDRAFPPLGSTLRVRN